MLRVIGRAILVNPDDGYDGKLRHFSVKYLSNLIDGPTIATLRDDLVLRSASFLKSGPAGTVFPLTEEQGMRIFQLLAASNQLPVADENTRSKKREQVSRQNLHMPSRTPQRAISIRQPYAEEIMQGLKVAEYRSVPTNITGRVYVYASQKPGDPSAYDSVALPKDLPRGVLVGTVEITNCWWWAEAGRYAYGLANPKRLRRRLKPTQQPQPIWFYPFGRSVKSGSK
jgi:hypothetical protein